MPNSCFKTLATCGWSGVCLHNLQTSCSNKIILKMKYGRHSATYTWTKGSVQFSRSVTSDCLQPHGLQHARLPCPSATPRACSNSCHQVRDAIQPSHPLSSPSLLAFYLSQHQGLFQWVSSFLSGGQRIEASGSVLPMNIQDWFPLGLTGLISLQSKGFSRVFSNTTVQKHQFFGAHLSLWSNSHIHTWLLEKP